MKRTFIAAFFILLSLAPGVFSIELELRGGLGNLAFDQDRTVALGDDAVKGRFSPNLYPLILARFSGEYRGFGYSAGFMRDTLIKNRLYSNFRAEFDYFFLEAGPFVGLFNSRKIPVNPGLSAAMGFMVPGAVFISLEGASTLALPMEIKGYYYQNNGGVSAGFWVPNVICSVNLVTRNHIEREQANLLIENNQTRWFFRADVFAKNFPYTIKVDLGFQDLKRSYITQKVSGTDIVNDTQTDELKSIFMGFDLTYTASQSLKLLLGAEMPVYSWSARPMKDPKKGAFFFRAWAGIGWTFPAKGE